MRSEVSIPVLLLQPLAYAFDFRSIHRYAEHRDKRLMLIAIAFVVELPCARDLSRGASLWSSDFGDVLCGGFAKFHGFKFPHVSRGTRTPAVPNNHPGRPSRNWPSESKADNACAKKLLHGAELTPSIIFLKAGKPNPPNGGFGDNKTTTKEQTNAGA